MAEKKPSLKIQLKDQQFKALIENAHEGIVLYNGVGYIKYASRSVKKVCGYEIAEVVGKTGTYFVHPEDVQDARDAFEAVKRKEGKSVTLIQRLRHKKGHYIWSESLLTNLSHIPEVEGVVSNFRDITEKKLAEERLQESQALLETVSRNLTEGIFMGILDKQFLYANDAFIKLLGYNSLEEIQALKPTKIFAKPYYQKILRESLDKKSAVKNIETLIKTKDGQNIHCTINVSLLRHEGKDNYFVGTLRDVSKEMESANQLLESKKFLDNIINTVAAPIFVKDEAHRFIMFNEKFKELLGLSHDELLYKTDRKFFSKKESEFFWKIDDEVLRSGKTIINEETLTSPTGKHHALLTVKSRYINEKGERFVIAFTTDITERKNIEDKIKELHANLEGILESSKESIFSIDNNFFYTAFNKRHKTIMKLIYGADIRVGENKLTYVKNFKDFSWIKSELIRALEGNQFTSEHFQNYKNYKGYIQTAYNPIKDEKNKVKGVAVFVQDITDRKRFEEIVKSINANLRGVMESTSDRISAIDTNYHYITFNKSHAEVIKKLFGSHIRAGQNVFQDLPRNVSKIIKNHIDTALQGMQFTSELELPKKQTVEISYNPIFNEKSKVTGVALFIRDTTERKKMEERLHSLNYELVRQNAQLEAQEDELKKTLEELSERNFELDQLMYKTSHDLRSPLSSIMGLINLANIDRDPDNVQQYLGKIEGRVKRLDEFIRSMLDYARVNRVDVEGLQISLEEIARKCLHELEYLDNFDKVKVAIKVKGDQSKFISDNLRLNIIFSNIISNAYKYYNPEVKSFLNISIRYNANGAAIVFEDNGIGIKKEHLDKIFNMFYRATDKSQGSGLGMYIVKQAVEKLNGSIHLVSEYGRGTQISISIPRYNKNK